MKQRNYFLICLLGIFSPFICTAQIGGTHVFEFLELPASARITGLAGSAIAVKDDDLNLGLANPALLNESIHKQIALSHSFHLAKTNHGYGAYGYHHEPWDISFHGGIQYVNYGEFVLADEFGNAQGTFKAKDFAINLGAATQVYDRVRAGANLKILTSQLEGYESFGLALDLGTYYQDTSGNFTVALVIRNIGYQLSTYRPGNNETLPFNIEAGITKRLKYLPFRLGITAHNLHRGNITYDDPNAVEPVPLFSQDEVPNENKVGLFVDNLFRHMIFNGEFLLGKKENLKLRFGYNHFRRRELTVDSVSRSLAGFSLGFGFKAKRFRFDFGHQFYALAGGNNHISLTTKLGRW